MRIASVEDDKDHAELIRDVLVSAGYECDSFSDGGSFTRALRDRSFDLFILDWKLPDINGDELVSLVRQRVGRQQPVLFLTNRSSEDCIIAALNAGADDYMRKPIRRGELVARVKALLRRSYPDMMKVDELIRVGEYVVDPVGQSISCRGQKIELAPREFELGLYLFRNIGRMVPREAIEKAVWGRAIGPESRTLDTHISKLRTKLMLRPENGVRLHNVYSIGFRLMTIADDEKEDGDLGFARPAQRGH